MTVPDQAWLGPLARRRRRTVAVRDRTPLSGGYGSGGAERIDLDDGTTVVLKRTAAVEAAALRAVAVVNGPVRLPRLLASGDGWVLLEHVDGTPLPDDAPVPDEVWRTLALVHAHWRRNRPRGIPVVDDAWWAARCRHAAERLRAAGHDGADLVARWADDERARTALRALPRTLCHGDAHRGNVLVGPSGAMLLDWGNARAAAGSLDTVVLTAPPADGPADAPAAPVPAVYRDTLHAALGAPDPPAMVAAENAWARAQAHVQYLSFAADHQPADRATSMIAVVTAALDEFGAIVGG